MQMLPESATFIVVGGAKPDFGTDPEPPLLSQPVPIWHPVFVTDPLFDRLYASHR